MHVATYHNYAIHDMNMHYGQTLHNHLEPSNETSNNSTIIIKQGVYYTVLPQFRPVFLYDWAILLTKISDTFDTSNI